MQNDRRDRRQPDRLTALLAALPEGAAAEQDPGAQDEAEVVPVPVVVNLVDVDVIAEQRDEKCDRCDGPLPEPTPETGDVAVRVRDTSGRVPAGRARGQQQRRPSNDQQKLRAILHPESPSSSAGPTMSRNRRRMNAVTPQTWWPLASKMCIGNRIPSRSHTSMRPTSISCFNGSSMTCAISAGLAFHSSGG